MMGSGCCEEVFALSGNQGRAYCRAKHLVGGGAGPDPSIIPLRSKSPHGDFFLDYSKQTSKVP